jgi:hypothetical protein
MTTCTDKLPSYDFLPKKLINVGILPCQRIVSYINSTDCLSADCYLSVIVSADSWVSKKGKNLLFAQKTTKKILFFPKKSKNILFLVSLGRPGGGGKSPPCPPLRMPMGGLSDNLFIYLCCTNLGQFLF